MTYDEIMKKTTKGGCMDKIQNRLDIIIGYSSAIGYINANYKNGRWYKRHHSYSIGEMAEIALDARKSNDEYMAKAIIIKFRVFHPEIDLDHVGKDNYCLKMAFFNKYGRNYKM